MSTIQEPEYSVITDNRKEKTQEKTYTTLNKSALSSKPNRIMMIALIINTCIALAAIVGVIYLLVNKQELESKQEKMETILNELNGN